MTTQEFAAVLDAGPGDFRAWLAERKEAGLPVTLGTTSQSLGCPFVTYANARLGAETGTGGTILSVYHRNEEGDLLVDADVDLPNWVSRFIGGMDALSHVNGSGKIPWPPSADDALGVLDAVVAGS